MVTAEDNVQPSQNPQDRRGEHHETTLVVSERTAAGYDIVRGGENCAECDGWVGWTLDVVGWRELGHKS